VAWGWLGVAAVWVAIGVVVLAEPWGLWLSPLVALLVLGAGLRARYLLRWARDTEAVLASLTRRGHVDGSYAPSPSSTGGGT
jgi:hypothetical protein